MFAVLLASLLTLSAPLLAVSDVDATTTVRVHILERERPASVTLTATNGPIDLHIDGRLLVTLSSGQSASLEASQSRILARAQGNSEAGAVLSTRGREGAVLRISAGRLNRAYRGDIEATSNGRGLHLINVVSLEDYIASVIPSEYNFPEIEGVKAQAVLIRTYALSSRGRFGTHDLVDHEGSQVYRGADTETPLARRAAELTRGEILTYQGMPIEAVYSSSSGGHTADNESVWDGRPVPYLRGRPDPYDRASPNYRWTETVDRSRLLNALSRAYGFQVTGFAIERTSAEGRVTSIRLLGARERVEQANRFRSTLNNAMGRQVLKSTFFTADRQGNRYVLRGRGFGHGVGLSQYGARQQAIEGRSYHEILAFYYNGVTLERRTSFTEPSEMIAEGPAEVRVEPITPRPASNQRSLAQTSRVGW